MFEFALVAGLIFIPLVFGIIEFGRLTFAKTAIATAAREGVRYAIVRGSSNTLETADSAAVANYVIGRTKLAPITVRPSWTGNDPGDTVTVRVVYSYTPFVPFIPSRTINGVSRQLVVY